MLASTDTPAPLIGRDRELDALRDSLTAACGGRGRTVLLTGEAGVGKSRLVTEARDAATTAGVQILQGTCFEADRSLPYAPFADLLRDFLADSARAADRLPALERDLALLLPELEARGAGVSAPAPLDAEQARHRLVQSVVRFVLGLAAARPLLLVVEDLHWADESSLELLHACARRLVDRPILLLLTYRSDEVGEALGHLLADLERERLAAEMSVQRLTAPDVHRMLRAILNQTEPLRPELLETVVELTDGNPFFVEELAKSLVGAGEHATAARIEHAPLQALRIPRTVQDAVQRRTGRLSEAARQVVVLAAVAGRRFDVPLLQAVTGYGEELLLACLKELIAAQLVSEESADRFQFRHALTREAVLAGLLARERRQLHQVLADLLEQRHPEPVDLILGDLALHYAAAEAWPKALTYARRAGERAQAIYAPRAAVAQFSRALAAAWALGAAVAADLLVARAQAYELLGEFEAARADYEAALALARVTGDRHAEWRVQLELGFLWAGRDYAQAGAHWERALDLARALAEPSTVAHSLNRLGNWRVNLARPDEGLRDHQEALLLFQEAADRRGIAETLDFLGLAAFETGDLVQSATWYRQAVALLEEVDDRPRLAFALALLMATSAGMYGTEAEVWAVADAAAPWQDGERALAIARAIGWRAGEAYMRIQLAGCYGPRGEYARALEEAHTALGVAEAIGHRQWRCAATFLLGALYGDLLAYDVAQRLLAEAMALAKEAGSVLLFTFAATLHAQVCIRGREFARAESVLAEIEAVRPPGRLIFGRLATAARAELLLARGAAAPALRLVEELLAPVGNSVIPYLWKLRGEAFTALRRYSEAEATLRQAETSARMLGLRSLQWRLGVALGTLYRAWGRTADAARAYETAHALIDGLAATLPEERLDEGDTLRDRFRTGALALLPRPRPPTPLRTAKQAYGGLTAREREVAALIARGRSNREIAALLVVSERTIESHVSHMLAKLGCDTRTAIAAWAVEQGLPATTSS